MGFARFVSSPAWHRMILAWVMSMTVVSAAAQVPYYQAKMLPATVAQGYTVGVALNDATRVAGYTQMGQAVGWSFADGLVTVSGDGQALGLASTSGAMVGWSRGGNGRPEAYLWSSGSGGVPLSSLYAGVPAYESIAHAVNNAGWVLISGRATASDSFRLMLLRPGEAALDFGDSGTSPNWGGGVANGIVAGSVSVPGNSVSGMVWTAAEGFRSFRVNGGDTFADGVNGSGWIVGRTLLKDDQGFTQLRGFVYDAAAGQTILDWPDFLPRDLNGAGLVVGTVTDSLTRLGTSAGAWTSGAVIDLNTRTAGLGPYELNQAVGVNAQGQILALGSLSADGMDAPPAGAQALATFVLSECLRCGQIKPNPNPSGTLLDVDRDWFDAFNAEDYRNFGALQVGTVLVNKAGARLRNAGSLTIYGPEGILINNAELINEASGTITVTRTFLRGAGSVTTNSGFVTLLTGGVMQDAAGAVWFDQPGSSFVQVDGLASLEGNWHADRSTWEQRGGRFRLLPGSLLELASTRATVGGTLVVGGRLELLPNLANAPNQPSTLAITGTVVVNPVGTLIGARSSIDVNGGQLVNAGGTLDLANDSRTSVRGGGMLRLEAGTTLSRAGAQIDVQGPGTTVAVLAGARLNLGGDLVVRGGALLDNAGSLTNRFTLLAEDAVVRSSGSFVNERGAFIVVHGSGATLDIKAPATPGDTFVNRGVVTMGADTLLRIEGSAVNEDTIAIGNGARLLVEGGRLHVKRGASIQGYEFVQHGGATFIDGLLDMSLVTFWSGVVGGVGTIGGSIMFGMDVEPDKTLTLRPGSSPGTLTIDGDLAINSAVMELEVGDFRRYDRLVVTGNLQVGRLAAVLMPEAGYSPDLNDRFDWLSAGSLSGDLSAATLDASALSGGWFTRLSSDAAGSRILLGNAAATSWGPDVIAAGTRYTLDAGSITEIESLRTVVGHGDVDLRGYVAIRNGAVLSTDAGTWTVGAGGRLTNRGLISNGGAGFINEGLVRNYDDGVVVMSGAFTNRGVLENAGSWDQSARFLNESGAKAFNYGTMFNRYAGGIINHGRFEQRGILENEGTIANMQGAEFVVAAGAEVRPMGFGLDSYRDFGGVTQVDGRLAATEILFQGTTVRGSGTLVGPVSGNALFQLQAGTTFGIEGSLAGDHSFDVWIGGADAFGVIAISGDVALQGGSLRFLLTEGGYMPQAGDTFRWLRAGASVTGLQLLVWRIDVHVPGENGFDYLWTPPAGLVLTLTGDTLAVAAVPEPAAWVTLVAGLCLVGGRVRRLGSA